MSRRTQHLTRQHKEKTIGTGSQENLAPLLTRRMIAAADNIPLPDGLLSLADTMTHSCITALLQAGVRPGRDSHIATSVNFVATNLLPNYLDCRFRTPDDVQIVADGACSMGSWVVKDAREIDIRYHAFGGSYLPAEKEVLLASCLFITGTKDQPRVTLNDQNVTTAMKPWTQDGVTGWLVSLTGAFPPDAEITNRLKAVNAAFAVR